MKDIYCSGTVQLKDFWRSVIPWCLIYAAVVRFANRKPSTWRPCSSHSKRMGLRMPLHKRLCQMGPHVQSEWVCKHSGIILLVPAALTCENLLHEEWLWEEWLGFFGTCVSMCAATARRLFICSLTSTYPFISHGMYGLHTCMRTGLNLNSSVAILQLCHVGGLSRLRNGPTSDIDITMKQAHVSRSAFFISTLQWNTAQNFFCYWDVLMRMSWLPWRGYVLPLPCNKHFKKLSFLRCFLVYSVTHPIMIGQQRSVAHGCPVFVKSTEPMGDFIAL